MNLNKIIKKIRTSELSEDDILKYGRILITEFAKEYHKEQLRVDDIMSSKILIEKDDLLKLTTKAIKEGFNTYEIVEAGLETFDPKNMAIWVLREHL